MTTPVAITGLGLVCPLGDDPERLHRSLCAGQKALAPPQLFDPGDLDGGPVGEVRNLDPVRYLGRGNLRPLDRAARLASSAAHLALTDAGWGAEQLDQEDVGLVLGTMYGSVHTISAFDRRALTAGPQYAKPLDFANSVINAAAGQTAIWHRLRGINSTLSGGTASGLQALAYGADLMRAGRAAALLAGGGDELCLESYLGFQRSGRLAGNGNGNGSRPVPFDRRRTGLALGEGAALMMLETTEAATARGARILGWVRGHGAAFDATRGQDEARAAGALARAVGAALGDAGVAPEDLGAVSAGANGSPAGDRAEALGLVRALGPALDRLPVTAVKGNLGEGLGAGGALQCAVLLTALGHGVLPGIAGLEEPDPECPVPLTTGGPRAALSRLGLATSLSRDGHACALILERAEPSAESAA